MKAKPHTNIPQIIGSFGVDIDENLRKELGKIETVSFGIRDGRLGLHLEFKFGAKGCIWSEWTWDFVSVERTDNTQWTELEREREAIELMKKISRYLNEAKVTSISELKNIPVECSFSGNMMKSWRVLKEVI